MKPFLEKDFHELFRIGIMVKAADGFLEACAGVFLWFANFAALNGVLLYVFRGEILESPRDTFWQYLIAQWRSFALNAHSFWSILFVGHGAIKLGLSWALLKNYFWAYPAALAVFSLLVGYEVYSLTLQQSLFLWIITFFDILVVGLIAHEYKHVRKQSKAA